MDDAEPCSFCDDSEKDQSFQQLTTGVVREIEPEPEWRQEVGRRLAEYRARRGYPAPAHDEASSAQAGLPFYATQKQSQPAENKERARPRTLARLRPVERMEISVQPELDFSAAASARAHPQTALAPVATIAGRRNAALVDICFILLTFAAFVGLFAGLMRATGWEIVLDRFDAVMCAPVLFLFYALYFVMFTVFAGVTPGMQVCGLSIVQLDGRLPDTAQLVWRAFGYLLSGATLSLGFLWAWWDEDGFSWQDRISQTYVTSSLPVADSHAVEIQVAERRPIRK